MRSTTLTAAVLAGGAALAAAVAHRRRTAPPLVDLDQVIAGARRIADVLESGDPIMRGLVTHGSDLVDVPADFGQLLAGFADTRPDSGGWPALPAAPLREGVGYLHDWLSSGPNPVAVLRELRDQAPIRPIADLLADIAVDLDHADTAHPNLATRLRKAEQQLREAAELVGETDYEADPHPADCPGGCGGSGQLMVTRTWDAQGDGIYVPVHEEPSDCRAGEPEAGHGADCECRGSGYTYEPGYRHLCLGFPALALEAVPTRQNDDPWASAATVGWEPSDEPPF